MVKNAFRRAGFKSGSLRIRSHCIRKFTIGRLQDAGVETNVWKTIVGKTVPEAAYSTEKLRESYLKALSKLDPSALVNNHARVKDLENQVERLTKQLEALEKKKGYQAMMELFKKYQSETFKESLTKSVPTAAINGKPVKPDPTKISAGEILALKAWAKTLQRLYSEGLKEEA